MLYFATLFDQNYLSRGLALYESMKKNIPHFKLFVLCLDDLVYQYFQDNALENVYPIHLSDIEAKDQALVQAKQNRSKIEYIFTLSPILPLYILENFKEIDLIFTLDADIYFYDHPQAIVDELKDKSILITPHRFSPKLKNLEIHGLYNVSFQAFRNDQNGLNCLHWWREKCIEWCYDKPEKDRFADQKYLDFFEEKFDKVVVLQHKGAGLAPWNVENYSYQMRNGKLWVGEQKLIFYHFHHLRFIRKKLIKHGLDNYRAKPSYFIKNRIYKSYINHLIRLNKKLGSNDHEVARINQSYSGAEFRDFLIYGHSFFQINPFWTIEIHLEKYYKWYIKLKYLLYGKAH